MENKTTYEITLSGCDDSTTIRMELSAAEAVLMRKVRDRVAKRSDYSCQPTMMVERAPKPKQEDTMDGEV